MDIIFKEKYVKFNQISRVTLMEIHDVLLDYNIELDLNDGFCNDWAGFSCWYFVNNHRNFGISIDEKLMSSFAYVITWFMTGSPIEIYSDFKSDTYYKNDKILEECLNIYNNLLKDYDSEIDICNNLIMHIYNFYIENSMEFLKKSERMNCLLTYKQMELFNKVDGDSYGDKLQTLLNHFCK